MMIDGESESELDFKYGILIVTCSVTDSDHMSTEVFNKEDAHHAQKVTSSY